MNFESTLVVVMAVDVLMVFVVIAIHCVSKKNDNDVLRYNFNAHQPILIIFGRYIAV